MDQDDAEEKPEWHVFYEVKMLVMTSDILRSRYVYEEESKREPEEVVEHVTRNAL